MVKGWIWQRCVREFVESLFRLAGDDRPIGEDFWQRLDSLIDQTGRSPVDTWVGFSWNMPWENRCELARGEGEEEGLVCVRLVAPDEWVPHVEAVLAGMAPLSELALSIRTVNCLESAGIAMVRELCCRTVHELIKIRNMNETTVKEVSDKLGAKGLKLSEG